MTARRTPPRTALIAATSTASFVVALAACLLVSGRASAQSAAAEALFADGAKLFKDGNIAPACDAFEASNRVEPRAGTLIRLGECREKNHQLASAWSAYKDALTRVKDPRKRAVAMTKAAALEPRLSYLTVSVPDDSRVDGLALTRDGTAFDPMLWNRALPVDGGDYVIAGRAPGHEEWQTIAHIAPEGARASVEVPKFKELIKLIAPPTPPPARPSATPLMAEPHDREAMPAQGIFTTRRKVAVGVAGLSVIGVVAGVVYGEASRTKLNEALLRCPDPATPCAQAAESNALIAASHTRSLEANIAFGVAAAAALGAAVLWFTGAPEAEPPRRISVVPSVAAREAGVIVLGRF
jgi:hypothetical protein